MDTAQKGEQNVLTRLSEHELRELKPLPSEVIKQALEEGRKDREAAEKHVGNSQTDSRLLFRSM